MHHNQPPPIYINRERARSEEMKGECVEEKDPPNSMFAKLHQTQKFQPAHLDHFQLITTSEEADSGRSPVATTVIPTAAKREPNCDGATIEVVRRPRGRPPGSKNKPKPPIYITRESEPAMRPYVLEVPGGVDVVEAVTRFSRKHNTGLCVLAGSGTVANVSLRQPMATPGATVTFHGRFDLLSLSATILQGSTSSITPPVADGFTITLAGPQGQIVGGTVVGELLAAGTVYVIAASFNNPLFHRLPMEDDVSVSAGNEGRSPSAVSGGGDDDSGHPPATTESCGLAFYSSHMPSEVIWAPTARQPPPHYG